MMTAFHRMELKVIGMCHGFECASGMTWFMVSFPSSTFIILVLLSDNPSWLMWVVSALFICLSALWAVVAFKVWQRIKKLKAL
jgi:hypothetical protein